jgi:hypothetical protein
VDGEVMPLLVLLADTAEELLNTVLLCVLVASVALAEELDVVP